MIKPFDFYFDFISPYSFLAHKQLKRIETKASIKIREEIVLPLLTIQQYALIKLQKNSIVGNKQKEIFEKIVTRSLFGNINASRNSA